MIDPKKNEEDITIATVAADESSEAIPVGITAQAAPVNDRPNYFLNPTEAMLAQARSTFLGGVLFIYLSGPQDGKFTVPKTIRAGRVLGGVNIDMSNADFVHPVTTIDLVGVLSGAKITVPRGVRVDVRGLGILGGFRGPRDTVNVATKAPLLIVRGLSVLGGCKVIVNYDCPELNIVA